MADENLENQTETQAEEQGAVQGEVQNANANRVKLGEGVYLEVTRVEVVGNLYDESGAPLGDGGYAVNLNAEQVLALGIANIQPIADKFRASAEA